VLDGLDVGVDGIRERLERTGVVQCPIRPVQVEMALWVPKSYVPPGDIRG
jgi:hypothetical protein